MANINDFKARLKGGGARANQFKVTLPFPGYSAVGGETATLAFLCNAPSKVQFFTDFSTFSAGGC